jgi:hypothetical protein
MNLMLAFLIFALIIAIIYFFVSIFGWLWDLLFHRKSTKNYSLPLLKAKGSVLSCYTGHIIGDEMIPRYLLLISDEDKQVIKVRIKLADDNNINLTELEMGDEGILFYRKKKRINYLVNFERTIVECKGVISQKKTHNAFAAFRDEYIVLCLREGEFVRVYIEMFDSKQVRQQLKTFDVGDKGTLYYYKGKRNKFMKFELENINNTPDL